MRRFATGKPVSLWQATEANNQRTGRDPDDPHVITVRVSKIRKTLGMDAVQTCRGDGYRLSPPMIAKIEGLLHAG